MAHALLAILKTPAWSLFIKCAYLYLWTLFAKFFGIPLCNISSPSFYIGSCVIAVICPWLLWLSLPFVILMLFLTHSILSPPKVLRIWKDLPHPLKLKFQNKIIINNELQTPRKATRYTGMISKIALTCKHHTEDAFSIIIRQLVWVWKVHLDSQICTLS